MTEAEYIPYLNPPSMREPDGTVRPATAEEIQAYRSQPWSQIREDLIGQVTPRMTEGEAITMHERNFDAQRGLMLATMTAEERATLDEAESESPGLHPSQMTFEQALDEELGRCRRVMIQRQRKYGKKNISKHGEVGVAIRFADKAERINNAYFDEQGQVRPHVLDESLDELIEDTFIDAANYSLIALMLRHGTWSAPLEENA